MSFWRNDFTLGELNFVLDRVREVRAVTPEGQVSFTGDFDKWRDVLVSAIGLEIRTNALRDRIIRETLFSPELKMHFTEADFKGVAYRTKMQLERHATKVYRVVFPVWNAPAFLRGAIVLDDVRLNPSPSKNTSCFRRISSSRDKQRSEKAYSFFFTDARRDDLEQCSTWIARVSARSPQDAHEIASEAVYEVLGVANIAKDFGKLSRRSWRTMGKLPVSDVLIGPHTTVHSEDGSLAHDGFWHEDWVGGPTLVQTNDQRETIRERRFLEISRAIAKSKWRAECRKSAVRYFKAFSNPNLEQCFLDGWRLFENIAGSQNEKIGVKLSRVSRVFKSSTEYKVLGKHLSLRRNLISHGHGSLSDDHEGIAFQMLQFVHPFLVRYMLNGFRFETLGRFWEFLDLPEGEESLLKERQKLRQRLSHIDKAYEFRGYEK
jgi:hypothetical protein